MTISSEVRKAGPFRGNGSATSFPFDFKIFSSSDLAVYLTDPSGAESVLGGSDYTAHMNADQESAPGGTVVKTTPLAAGYLLTITSKLPYLQPVRLTNQGGFYPEVINTALDRLTVFAQQLDEQVGRAFKVPISSSTGAGNTVADYVNQAADSATAAAASAVTAGNFSTQSAGFAANSAASAAASAASAAAAASAAQAATTPTAAALSAYLDAFFPANELMLFADMYVLGGWDLGVITPASPFTNETTTRRASMSGGSGAFNFGTVP